MDHIQVAIIGAGFGGIGAAVEVSQMGAEVLVFERGSDVGGTWAANTYPGCACDVPSILYSFSFAPDWPWSRKYASQEEILAYLRGVVERYQLGPKILLEHDVTKVEWDAATQGWRIETNRGTWTADAVIAAWGALSEPRIPRFEGLESFEGTTIHSARWDPATDLTGRKVAVVGTGASAIQIVPAIAPQVGSLSVFQRTPPWVMPRHDKAVRRAGPTPARGRPRLLARMRTRARRWLTYWTLETNAPGFVRWTFLMRPTAATARRHLRSQVSAPALQKAWEPGYVPGCKRILLSDDWYPALQLPNVEVVGSPIERFDESGIVTSDGRHHDVHTVIMATGFAVSGHPMPNRIYGTDGSSLLEHWIHSGTSNYLGTLVPGFPNLFLITGPNTGVGHTSLIFMIESQLRLIRDALRIVLGPTPSTLEIRRETCSRLGTKLSAMNGRTVWSTGGCKSWYLDSRGNNFSLWPSWTWHYHWLTRKIDPDMCVITPLAAKAGGAKR